MIFISHTRITPTQVLNPIGAPTGAAIGFSQQLHVSASWKYTQMIIGFQQNQGGGQGEEGEAIWGYLGLFGVPWPS